MAGPTEGSTKPLEYEIQRQTGGFVFSARMPGGVKTTLPVKVVMGGERHGLSFLLSIDKLGGIPLERPALIEARYVYNWPNHALAISPGFASETPGSYEDAFGRVLSPGFQEKCLTCHGEPGTLGAGQPGRSSMRELPWARSRARAGDPSGQTRYRHCQSEETARRSDP